MKKILVSVLTLLLCAVIALSLVACGGGGEETPENNGPKEDVSAYHSGDGFETINDPLSWEAINKFPVVHDGMTIEEGRKLVVDFFRYCKTAVWMPSDNYEYKIKEANAETQEITGYVKYGGLPYISLASGNIYRLMDYMDPETHVVDIEAAGKNPLLFGNQCSFGSYIGVGRVINSAKYSWTKGMTPYNNFVPVGDYQIKNDVENFSASGYNTIQVLADNSQDVMYESYAGLKAGDVIVYYTTAGHVVLISEDAHVVRYDDGKINPGASYVTVIDQTPGHDTMTNTAGDTFAYEKNVDEKWSFQQLIQRYVPYTFKEWLGEDPIESSWCKYSHTGDTISMEQISGTEVTSNYGITDIYVSVYHSNGKEVYKWAIRAQTTSVKELKFSTAGANVEIWGAADDLDPEQEYTVKVYAQLSTGERPTIWEGKLAQ